MVGCIQATEAVLKSLKYQSFLGTSRTESARREKNVCRHPVRECRDYAFMQHGRLNGVLSRNPSFSLSCFAVWNSLVAVASSPLRGACRRETQAPCLLVPLASPLFSTSPSVSGQGTTKSRRNFSHPRFLASFTDPCETVAAQTTDFLHFPNPLARGLLRRGFFGGPTIVSAGSRAISRTFGNLIVESSGGDS